MRALLLAAGVGSRLRPLTNILPKCLMPIKGYPLLGYWINQLGQLELEGILVNLHHQAEFVQLFLDRIDPKNKITRVVEPELLGTAGTLAENHEFFCNNSALVIHADNLCICDLDKFISHHHNIRPKHCAITMMTFHTNTPHLAGIIEVDNNGIAINMLEKSKYAKDTLANAAIYVFEPEVIDWISKNQNISDITTQVLPQYMGRISTWHNNQVHIDIGNIDNLRLAQKVDIDTNQKNQLPKPLLNQIRSIETLLNHS